MHQILTALRAWHWKAALLSALVRCALFFAANASSGWKAAGGAALTEFVYRFIASGYYGAMTQSLSRMRPFWRANLLAILVLPFTQHAIEYLIHWWRRTPNLNASIGISVAFTVISTLFNLYSMRHGAMLVGKGANTLWEDLAAFPLLAWNFLLSGPRLILRLQNR